MKAVDEVFYKYVYGLYFRKPNGEMGMFYIGRTNNLKRRLQEHNHAKRKGTEDKYAFIRELEKNNISWNMVKIKEAELDEYTPDWERWFVIDYIRNGHPIQNMKHGDLDNIDVDVKNNSIQSVEDVKRERIAREEKQAGEAAAKLRESVLNAEQEERIDDVVEQVAEIQRLTKTLYEMISSTGWEKYSDPNKLINVDGPTKRRRLIMDYSGYEWTIDIYRTDDKHDNQNGVKLSCKDVGEVVGRNIKEAGSKLSSDLARKIVAESKKLK